MTVKVTLKWQEGLSVILSFQKLLGIGKGVLGHRVKEVKTCFLFSHSFHTEPLHVCGSTLE